MTTRRLAAILAADVAGFSAMMERDEGGAGGTWGIGDQVVAGMGRSNRLRTAAASA